MTLRRSKGLSRTGSMKSRRSKKRRTASGDLTPAQRRDRFDALHAMGCVVCRRAGRYAEPEVHHLRGAPWSGMGQRASDAHTIPLCPPHHRLGGDPAIGYHQSPAAFETAYGTQAELLEYTDRYLAALEELPW